MTREEIRAQLTDQQALICTLQGEAANESAQSKLAVACAVRNRVKMDLHNDGKPDWWGEGYKGVCLKSWQFSCWWEKHPNTDRLYALAEDLILKRPLQRPAFVAELRQIADSVMLDLVDDITGGATHYLTVRLLKQAPPAWVAKATYVTTIGSHAYFKDVA